MFICCFSLPVCCLIFFSLLSDSCRLSQVPCLFSQGIAPAAHSDVFTRLGIAAHHRCYLFDAKITAALCELVPGPETIFLLWRPHRSSELEGTSWSLAPEIFPAICAKYLYFFEKEQTVNILKQLLTRGGVFGVSPNEQNPQQSKCWWFFVVYM